MTHINALLLNLSNERNRLANAKTKGEIELRKVWVNQLEKEVAAEEKFLANKKTEEMTEDQILEALGL